MPGLNSQAKPSISRRTPAKKRERIRRFADWHGISYSAAEERLLERGLAAENGLPAAPPMTEILFFGRPADDVPFADPEQLADAWGEWSARIKAPFDSWWAHWAVGQGLSAAEADERAEAARQARVTARTGTSWAEFDRATGEWLIFLTHEDTE